MEKNPIQKMMAAGIAGMGGKLAIASSGKVTISAGRLWSPSQDLIGHSPQ